MILYNIFVKVPENFKAVNRALSELYSTGIYPVLLELMAYKLSEKQTQKDSREELRAAWHDGYLEALQDIFQFEEKHKPKEAAPRPAADFGARAKLVEEGELTREELEKFESKQNTLRRN